MSLQGVTVTDGDDRGGPALHGGKYNAIKHGLTAKTPVFPGEDPEELEALIDAFKASKGGTRNRVEEALAKLGAMAFWRCERANRLEAHRVARDIVVKTENAAAHEARSAGDLGRRLFHDVRGPEQIYPSPLPDRDTARTSGSGKPEDDSDHPGDLVIDLEATRAGRAWLLDAWRTLRTPIEAGSVWHSSQKLQAIRLKGKQPLDGITDAEVALVFLASHAMKPLLPWAFYELQCEMSDERVKGVKKWLEREEMKVITPASAAEGRDVLLAMVDTAIERLLRLEAERSEAADFVEELDGKIPSDPETKMVGQVQRHFESSSRLAMRSLHAIDQGRRNEADAWGMANLELRQRREEARQRRTGGKGPYSGMLVVDEQGTVRAADTYEGNVQEGLARFTATVGRQPCEEEVAPSRDLDLDQGSRGVIPDFARWVNGERGAVVGGGIGAERFGGGNGEGVRGDRATGEHGGSRTLLVTSTDVVANVQNKIGEPSVSGEGVAAVVENGRPERCGSEGGEACSALSGQGLVKISNNASTIPRALPWAELLGPFRAGSLGASGPDVAGRDGHVAVERCAEGGDGGAEIVAGDGRHAAERCDEGGTRLVDVAVGDAVRVAERREERDAAEGRDEEKGERPGGDQAIGESVDYRALLLSGTAVVANVQNEIQETRVIAGGSKEGGAAVVENGELEGCGREGDEACSGLSGQDLKEVSTSASTIPREASMIPRALPGTDLLGHFTGGSQGAPIPGGGVGDSQCVAERQREHCEAERRNEECFGQRDAVVVDERRAEERHGERGAAGHRDEARFEDGGTVVVEGGCIPGKGRESFTAERGASRIGEEELDTG